MEPIKLSEALPRDADIRAYLEGIGESKCMGRGTRQTTFLEYLLQAEATIDISRTKLRS